MNQSVGSEQEKQDGPPGSLPSERPGKTVINLLGKARPSIVIRAADLPAQASPAEPPSSGPALAETAAYPAAESEQPPTQQPRSMVVITRQDLAHAELAPPPPGAPEQEAAPARPPSASPPQQPRPVLTLRPQDLARVEATAVPIPEPRAAPVQVRTVPPAGLRLDSTQIQQAQSVQIPADLAAARQPVSVQPRPLQIIEITSPPPAPSRLVAQPVERKIIRPHELRAPRARLIITQEDVVAPTTVLEPLDRTQVGQWPIEVSGKAQPNSQLALETNGFQAQTRVAADGNFRFQGIQLHDGWNNICVWSLAYPAFARCQTIIQVYRQARPLLFVGQRDLFSQSVMQADNDVIRCRRCRTFSKRDSWRHVPGCANCLMYGGSQEFWTSDDPQFYEERRIAL